MTDFESALVEGQDRGLIRVPITDQLDAGKAAHRGDLNQGLLHGWVAEGIPLLQQMTAQHRGQRVGRPAALLAGLWIVGLDQIEQSLPGTTASISERNFSGRVTDQLVKISCASTALPGACLLQTFSKAALILGSSSAHCYEYL